MKVYVGSVGCEQRGMEAQRIIDYLKINRVDYVSSPQSCDYAILLTCGVDKFNQDNSISALEDILKKMQPSAKMILGGCLPSINPTCLSSYRIAGTFSPANLESLDNLLGFEIRVPITQINNSNHSISNLFEDNKPISNQNLARREYEKAKKGFKIKIDEGCLLSCSYCTIRKATGRLRSEPLEKILEQYEQARDLMEPTVMLMGGDTGAYGRDIHLGLPELLNGLLQYSTGPKIFIHDFNVNWLIEEIDKYRKIFLKSESSKRIQSVVFPIQSGSDRILKLMRRPYTAQATIEALRSVKNTSPSLRIGTHMIVGFPSESDLDFQSTINLLKSSDFDFISCFGYSENEFTDSRKIQEKIERDTIIERLRTVATTFKDKVRVFEC